MPLNRLIPVVACLATSAVQAATLPPPPVARNDTYLLNSLTLNVGAPGLLANDSGTAIYLRGYYNPTAGTLNSVITNGSFVYTPDRGFDGIASFDYLVEDAFGRTASATVTIDASQSRPVARDDFYTASTTVFTLAAPGLLSNDSGGIGNVIVSAYNNPSSGTLETVVTNGQLRYRPDHGFAGVATFRYFVMDELGRRADAVAHIDYAASIPVAFEDSFTVLAGETLDIAAPGLLSNDFGGLGEVIVAGYFDPVYGTLERVVTDGSFRYVAPTSFIGIDTFSYVSMDDLGRTSTTTVSITVTPVPEPGTWLMLLAGIPLLARAARRR